MKSAIEIADKLLEAPSGSVRDFILDQPTYRVMLLVFKQGSGPYGSGGWSRNARHRPQPEVVDVQTNDVRFEGKSVYVNGIRRLKANVWQAGSPLRLDYPDLKLSS